MTATSKMTTTCPEPNEMSAHECSNAVARSWPTRGGGAFLPAFLCGAQVLSPQFSWLHASLNVRGQIGSNNLFKSSRALSAGEFVAQIRRILTYTAIVD